MNRALAFLVVCAYAFLGTLYARHALADGYPGGAPFSNGSGGGGVSGAADSGSGTNQEIAYWVGAKLGGSSSLTYNTGLGEVKALANADSRYITGTSDLTSHLGLYPSFGSDINGATADDGDFDLVTHSDSFTGGFISARSRGTHSNPSVVQNGDQLLDVEGDGWNGTIFFGSAASIRAYATETFSSTAHGTRITLNTFKNANMGANAWTFGQDGSLTSPQGFRNFNDGSGTIYTTADALSTNDRTIILSDSLSGKAWLEASTNSGGYLVCGAPDSAKLTGLGQTLPNVHDGFCSAYGGDLYLLAASGSANGVRLKADGGWGLKEQTEPTGESGYATDFADSTTHTRRHKNGTDSADDDARSVTAFSSQQTSTSTSYVDVLTVSLAASSKYHCAIDGVFQESVAADGVKVLLNPGATTVTSDAIHGELYDGDALLGGGALNNTAAGRDASTAGSTVELSDASVTSGHFVFSYNVQTSAAMTWKIQAAQKAHTTGTLTVNTGVTAVCMRL